MKENKEVESLFKNIHEGIKFYGIKGLNNAIVKTLNKKTGNTNEIDFIVNMICSDLNILKHNLLQSRKHGSVQKARQMCYCLLYFDVGLSLREIGAIFNKYVRSIACVIENYRKLNPEFKLDQEYLAQYHRFQKKYTEYITEQKNK
jgi:chromosomal replication initiation ATPase DnaA